MAKLNVTLKMIDSVEQNTGADEKTVDDIITSIEDIVEISGCRMVWGDPTSDSVCWILSFKNESQEESALSMVNDLIIDYPGYLTVDTVMGL